MAFKIIIMMMEKLLDQPSDLPYSDIKKMASIGQQYDQIVLKYEM